ncbi:MAG: MFS transporter [Candidatus Bathyarchaeota archaeon]|nr:MFS transporter [Candidatus Bathyarchaeota archaeon]
MRLKSLLFTSLGHFINDGEGFLVPVIVAVLVSQRGITPLEVTLMYLAFYLSSAVLSVYVGRFADKTGYPIPIIAVGLSVVSIGFLGFYLSASYTSGLLFFISLIVSAFLAGLGGAFFHPLSATVLQTTFEEKARGKALGINGAFGSVGRALYPSFFFLIAALVTTFDAIAVLSAVGFLAALAIWIGLKVPKIKTVSEQLPDKKAKFRGAFTKGIVVLTIVTFVRSLAVIGVNSWIPTFISIQKGVGITNLLGITLTVMYASAIIGQPLFGVLVDKFDKRLIFGLSSAGSSLSILGYLFTTGVSEIVFLSLFGFFAFSAFPLAFALSRDYAPEGGSSLANALVWGLGVTGGGAVGPIVTGLIVANDYANLALAFEVMAIIAMISALATILIPKAKKSTKVPLFH